MFWPAPCSHQDVPHPECSLFGLHPTRFSGGSGGRAPAATVSRLPLWPPPGPWAEGTGRRASASCPLRWGCNCGVLLPRLGPCPGPPQSSLSSGRLTIAAVSELAVLSNLQFGGVGGGDAVTGLHAVPLFQLCQGAHEAGVGSVQGGDALLLRAKRV